MHRLLITTLRAMQAAQCTKNNVEKLPRGRAPGEGKTMKSPIEYRKDRWRRAPRGKQFTQSLMHFEHAHCRTLACMQSIDGLYMIVKPTTITWTRHAQ
ncbi:hypothetical protein KY495_22750 [Massilia sp. PAMC28688]|uniref:hypothetical protein n=1 Tax=Massilia sp. PAMC28688 TaxID=2861283 RepID=UPI001C62D859|nr:hypothetical protein [Massilia sp. PAMC28688]QYF93450.1 hypothetical protein KY495_22750 [Massilia sp. PAMC28688]